MNLVERPSADAVLVELLSVPDCPNVATTRQLVRECLIELDLDATVVEHVGRYRSPTVLVNGADVMDGAPVEAGRAACRLDVPGPRPCPGRAHCRAHGVAAPDVFRGYGVGRAVVRRPGHAALPRRPGLACADAGVLDSTIGQDFRGAVQTAAVRYLATRDSGAIGDGRAVGYIDCGVFDRWAVYDGTIRTHP